MAKRKTTTQDTIITYVNKEGLRLIVTPKFTYEVRSFLLKSGRLELTNSETVTETSIKKVSTNYIRDDKSKIVKIKDYELLGAPEDWLQKNKFKNEQN